MLFTILWCILPALTGFANGQVAVQTGMTSDSHCGEGYCFTALYNPQNKMINYTLIVPKGGSPLGWYGVAQGREMEGANMAINWVNGDKTLTTSHRSTKEMIEPKTSQVTVKSFTLNSDISQTKDGQTIWSWNMPMTKDPQNAVQHVFANSVTSPSSSSVDATLVKHFRHDTGIILDLSKPYDGSPPKYPNPTSTPPSPSKLSGGSGGMASMPGMIGSSSESGDMAGMPGMTSTSSGSGDMASMPGMTSTSSNDTQATPLTASTSSGTSSTSGTNTTTSAPASNSARSEMKGKITLLFVFHVLFCVIAWQLFVN